MMLEHYKKTDYDFIIKVKDWIKQVNFQHKIKLTNFLNPHEQQILKNFLAKEPQIKMQLNGGFGNSERKRAIIFPEYLDGENLNHQIAGYKIVCSDKSKLLEHRQILGTLMSLNINRSIIGDIVFLSDDEIYLAICEEFSTFITENFTTIGRTPLNLIQTELQEIKKEDLFEEFEIIVSSMRFDVIVASLVNDSRSHIHDMIKQGIVQLNHSIEKNHSKLCQWGDVISIKRHGRYKLITQKKVTKNQKIIMVIGKAV